MAGAALLFDLDGTLWDSRRWFAALVGRDGRTARRVALDALRQKRPAATLLKQAGITKAQFARLCHGDVLVDTYPTVVDTLDGLQAKGQPLGAVTNLPAWMAEEMLSGLELRRFFGSVVTWGTTTRHKPHPDPILHALSELKAKPSRRVWYVGDSSSDCTAAHAAGLSFAWAAWGYDATAPAGADEHLDRFEQVLSL